MLSDNTSNEIESTKYSVDVELYGMYNVLAELVMSSRNLNPDELAKVSMKEYLRTMIDNGDSSMRPEFQHIKKQMDAADEFEQKKLGSYGNDTRQII